MYLHIEYYVLFICIYILDVSLDNEAAVRFNEALGYELVSKLSGAATYIDTYISLSLYLDTSI